MREESLVPGPRKGRGAVSNPAGRFERHEIVPFDDGWGTLGVEPPRLPTTVTPEPARTIIATNDSPDVPFDNMVNPDKGCEHGCVYCFARQTHAYLGLSAGLDFETTLFFEAARKRHRLDQRRLELDTTRFCVPPRAGSQQALF